MIKPIAASTLCTYLGILYLVSHLDYFYTYNNKAFCDFRTFNFVVISLPTIRVLIFLICFFFHISNWKNHDFKQHFSSCICIQYYILYNIHVRKRNSRCGVRIFYIATRFYYYFFHFI